MRIDLLTAGFVALVCGVVPARAENAPPMTLHEAIAFGLTHNRTILFQQNQRVAERAELTLSLDKFTPKANLVAQYLGTKVISRSGSTSSLTSNGTNLLAGPAVAMTLPTGATIELELAGGRVTSESDRLIDRNNVGTASLSIRQPLLRGAGTSVNDASVEQARHRENANKLTLVSVVNQAVSEIILAYRELLRARRAVDIAAASLQRSKALLDETRQLIDAGRLPANEITLSETGVYQQEIALLGAQNTAAKAEVNFLSVIGADQSGNVSLARSSVADYAKFGIPEAVSRAFGYNPKVAAQTWLIEVAEREKEIAHDATRWDLSLVGTADYAQAGSGFEARDRRTELTAGIQLTIPLNNLEAETRETEATVALRQAQLQLAQIKADVERDVRNAILDVDGRWKQYQLAIKSSQSAAQSLEDARKKLGLGRTTNFEVQSLEDELRLAQTAELDAMIDYENALTQVDLAIGTTSDTWGISL